jgi:hypothetical protein
MSRGDLLVDSQSWEWDIVSSWRGMTARIWCFHFVHCCPCKRKFKGAVPQDFWLQVSWISFHQAPEYLVRAVSNLFKNLPQVSLTLVTNLQRWPAAHMFFQICKFLGSIRNCNSGNFWDIRVPKFQICKFCWWASLQIFHRKTERIKHLFLKFPLCAADFSLLNLPKGKSLGRSKPATSSYAQAPQHTVWDYFYYIQALLNCLL